MPPASGRPPSPVVVPAREEVNEPWSKKTLGAGHVPPCTAAGDEQALYNLSVCLSYRMRR